MRKLLVSAAVLGIVAALNLSSPAGATQRNPPGMHDQQQITDVSAQKKRVRAHPQRVYARRHVGPRYRYYGGPGPYWGGPYYPYYRPYYYAPFPFPFFPFVW